MIKTFLKRHLSNRQIGRLKSIRETVTEYVSPFNWLWLSLFGARRQVEHIWPPQNFSDRSRLLYHLVDKPLARRGIFIPQHTSAKKISPTRFKTFHNEHIVIDKMLKSLGLAHQDIFFVDIGAGDGIDLNNTYLLAAGGAKGIALEFNPSKFAMMSVTYRELPSVSLGRCSVSPENICPMLEGLGAPNVIDVLNLDIDSFDYFVLESLLKKYRFKILCLEINPIFPLDIDFTVTYPNNEWGGGYSFQSMSLSMLYKLLSAHNYSIVHIDNASVFAAPDSLILVDFPQIVLADLQTVLDTSVTNDSKIEILKKYRKKDTDTLLKQISKEFEMYKPTQFYLGRSDLL
jgi:hypothetical protein